MKYAILASAFDPFPHPGHVWAMKQAIDYGFSGILAAIHIDPSIENPKKHKPILSMEERTFMLTGIKYVDWIEYYKTEAELHGLMIRYKDLISVRIIGEDHRNDVNNGDDLGIPAFFAKRRPDWSSTEFIKRIQACRLPS